MSEDLSFAARPIIFTHWDPDVHPYRSQLLPPIQELVLHILAYGDVKVKEVDLFLNPRIRSYFSNDTEQEQLGSLLQTGRLQVLLPPKSTKFDVAPVTSPLTAVALERMRSHRPFKDQPPTFTPQAKSYCARLDSVIAQALPKSGAIAYRAEFPANENTFANKLSAVLRLPDKTWRNRTPFSGITARMEERFLALAEDPKFYRSAVYAESKSEQYDPHQRQSIRNLAQSVYAYCELRREGAAGTYVGSRIAEIPPTEDERPVSGSTIRVIPVPGEILIPMASNIGELINDVLARRVRRQNEGLLDDGSQIRSS